MILYAFERSRGNYDSHAEEASFCGSGGMFAKDCYSVNGCSTKCVETAKNHDPQTGGDVKYYDAVSFSHNLTQSNVAFAEVETQLLNRGMVMDKNGNVTPLNPLSREALQQAIGAGTVNISAPTGLPPRDWTEQEKADVVKAMERIASREEAANR